MLDLSNSLLVVSSFQVFMSPVGGIEKDLQLLGARGLKTLTSKNARSCLSSQNPCAETSRRAPSLQLDVLCVSVSPVSGCSVGSVATLGQISVTVALLSSL